MVIAKNVFDFEINDEQFVIANGLKVLELRSKTLLVEFDKPVNKGTIVLYGNNTFVGDIYGVNKGWISNEDKELDFAIRYSLNDGSFIAHLNSPKRTVRLDINGDIIWECNFKSFRCFISDDYIIMQDRRISDDKKLVVMRLDTGEIINTLSFGESLPAVLACVSGKTWISLNSEESKFIRLIENESGKVLDEISSNVVKDAIRAGVNIELMQLDLDRESLIHPYGNIKIIKHEFLKSLYFDNYRSGSKIWTPDVFPFMHNEKYIIFGIHEDFNNDNKTVSKLVILDRKSSKALSEESINLEIEDVGIVKMVIHDNMLYILDSRGFLSERNLNKL